MNSHKTNLMETVVNHLRNSRAFARAILVTAIALAVYTGPTFALASIVSPTHGPAIAAGFGFWEVLGCVGCIAGFLVGAGTTIAGLAVFLAANPEIAVVCVATCSLAT